MLENLSIQPPGQSASKAGAQLAPDRQQARLMFYSGQILPEPHLLIAPAGKPEALRLPVSTGTSEPNPMQVLVLSGLKIGADEGGQLTDGIEKALALLRWMGQVTQETSEEIGV